MHVICYSPVSTYCMSNESYPLIFSDFIKKTILDIHCPLTTKNNDARKTLQIQYSEYAIQFSSHSLCIPFLTFL